MVRQFVIVAVVPGCEMFISSTRADVSDKVDGALRFTYGEDNPDVKVAAYNRMTGLDCWVARPIPAELTVERVRDNLEFMSELLRDTGGADMNPKLADDIATANEFLAGRPVSAFAAYSLREFIAHAEGEA